MKLNKDDIYGIAGSVAFHLFILLILGFTVLKTVVPDEDGGILVNFGNVNAAAGTFEKQRRKKKKKSNARKKKRKNGKRRLKKNASARRKPRRNALPKNAARKNRPSATRSQVLSE